MEMTDANVTGLDQVDLADKKVETNQFDRYKGRKDVTDRIAILSSKLVRTFTYYLELPGKKVLFRQPKSEEVLALCRERLGEPQQRFGLVLFHYRTDEKGLFADPKKCQGRPKLWVWSEARYEEISNIQRSGWPLTDAGFVEKQVDLQITCTEENFQRMQFTPCPEAHWKRNEKWYKALKEKEAKAKDKLKLALGREMSDLEIMSLFGASVPSQTGDTANAADIDLSDVLGEDDAVDASQSEVEDID